MLKPQKRGRYLKVTFSIEGIPHQISVHRLVAVKYVANPAGKPEVNHKNGVRSDNRASNLEWVTCSENNVHAYATGLSKAAKGEKQGHAKLTANEVLEIRHLRANSDLSFGTIGEMFGVSAGNCQHIVARDTWRHI